MQMQGMGFASFEDSRRDVLCSTGGELCVLCSTGGALCSTGVYYTRGGVPQGMLYAPEGVYYAPLGVYSVPKGVY